MAILNEKNVHADDVIVLQDSHAQLEALQKRWYKTNRAEIDREIREREEHEANERRIRDEEQKYIKNALNISKKTDKFSCFLV